MADSTHSGLFCKMIVLTYYRIGDIPPPLKQARLLAYESQGLDHPDFNRNETFERLTPPPKTASLTNQDFEHYKSEQEANDDNTQNRRCRRRPVPPDETLLCPFWFWFLDECKKKRRQQTADRRPQTADSDDDYDDDDDYAPTRRQKTLIVHHLKDTNHPEEAGRFCITKYPDDSERIPDSGIYPPPFVEDQYQYLLLEQGRNNPT